LEYLGKQAVDIFCVKKRHLFEDAVRVLAFQQTISLAPQMFPEGAADTSQAEYVVSYKNEVQQHPN